MNTAAAADQLALPLAPRSNQALVGRRNHENGAARAAATWPAKPRGSGRARREAAEIQSHIKALSIQSACKPEKRTRSRARMSFDTQESTCVSAMAKTNENRTVMCWTIAHRSGARGQNRSSLLNPLLYFPFVLGAAEKAFRFS